MTPTCGSGRCRRRSKRCAWRFRSFRRERRRSTRRSRARRRPGRWLRCQRPPRPRPHPARRQGCRRSGCSIPPGRTTSRVSGTSASAASSSICATFPRSELSGDAQFYIGDCYSSAGKFNEAVEAYDKVLANAPRSSKVPDSLYKRGLAFERLDQFDRARRIVRAGDEELSRERGRASRETGDREGQQGEAVANDRTSISNDRHEPASTRGQGKRASSHG